jgi:2-C-methyl-D-erythritol 4-phosphate cytidylyltransferase
MSGAGREPDRPLRVGVAVPAAGVGVRMGGARKAFLKIAGHPVLEHALRPFLDDERVGAVVVALAPADAAAPPEWLTSLDPRILVVPGGETRSQSVRAAVAALPDDVDVIAVHDAARPLVTREVVGRCLELARHGHGAVAGCPAIDTMKVVDESGAVVETPERSVLWHAHTPQVFPAAVLRAAYGGADPDGTDDAALVERHDPSVRVEMVDDGGSNLKVTRPHDVPVAEAILTARSVSASRLGAGAPAGTEA